MATKRVCDRCGADINPTSSASYVRLRRAYEGTTTPPETELCVSCARQIREWLKPVEITVSGRKEDDYA